jgi:hypothetical protein
MGGRVFFFPQYSTGKSYQLNMMLSQILVTTMAKQKAPDARLSVCRGMRRTCEYVAVTYNCEAIIGADA